MHPARQAAMAAATDGAGADAGSSYNVQELVQRAEHAVTTLQPELAVK